MGKTIEELEAENRVLRHCLDVQHFMDSIGREIIERGIVHDLSKLQEPEKGAFEKMNGFEFGTPEYERTRLELGDALQHHYEINNHHPEFYKNGVSGMTLTSIIEMVCDWMAIAKAKGTKVNIDYLSDRFGIQGQLLEVIKNSLLTNDVL